jgi:hypothetical protein
MYSISRIARYARYRDNFLCGFEKIKSLLKGRLLSAGRMGVAENPDDYDFCRETARLAPIEYHFHSIAAPNGVIIDRL